MHPCKRGALSQWAEMACQVRFSTVYTITVVVDSTSPVTLASLLRFSPLQAVAMQEIGPRRERVKTSPPASLFEQAVT